MTNLGVVICTAALVLLSQVSAAHLKVHVEPHRKKVEDVNFSDAPVKYLQENIKSIYAVCSFYHDRLLGSSYSLGYFDEAGRVLEVFCGVSKQLDFETIAPITSDTARWTTTWVDDVSVCYTWDTEEMDAQYLMTHYSCK